MMYLGVLYLNTKIYFLIKNFMKSIYLKSLGGNRLKIQVQNDKNVI